MNKYLKYLTISLIAPTIASHSMAESRS